MASQLNQQLLDSAHNQIRLHWDELFRNGQMIQYDKDQVLFYEGHFPFGAYALAQGQVQLASSRDTKIITSLPSQPPPIIGLDFLITEMPLPFSAQALSKIEICFLPKSLIFGILKP